MQDKQKIKSEIDFTRTFKTIAQAYEEISVMNMQKVRKSVLTTRDYYMKLSEVYFEVKRSYTEYQKELEKKAKVEEDLSKPIEIKRKKKPLVSILVSANNKLYGAIIGKVFKLFYERTQKDSSDIIIIGRIGRDLYEQQSLKKPYRYFEISDKEVSFQELRPVIYHLVEYDTINVYYGKFESFINQQAAISTVSGDKPFLETQNEKSPLPKKKISYLFEPSIGDIMYFFEDMIASSLFRQTVFESQLARHASRVLSMEKAQQNIETELKKLMITKRKVDRLLENKKQIERFSGISLWMK